MYTGTLTTWLLSIPTVMIMFLCIQAEYLLQILGFKGATVVLIFCWLDSILATAVFFMSAQRVTYAIARDNILPGSRWIRKMSANKMPINAAIVVLVFSIVIEAAIIGSTTAFTALTAAATISTNLSYLIPLVARHTCGRTIFRPGRWHLGVLSLPIGIISTIYILFLFVVLLLPQVYPVTSVSQYFSIACQSNSLTIFGLLISRKPHLID